jgi:hypothetical protein
LPGRENNARIAAVSTPPTTDAISSLMMGMRLAPAMRGRSAGRPPWIWRDLAPNACSKLVIAA